MADLRPPGPGACCWSIRASARRRSGISRWRANWSAPAIRPRRLGLITLAATVAQHWDIRLVNRNTEELTDADLDWADMVMTGGMLAQQVDTLA